MKEGPIAGKDQALADKEKGKQNAKQECRLDNKNRKLFYKLVCLAF